MLSSRRFALDDGFCYGRVPLSTPRRATRRVYDVSLVGLDPMAAEAENDPDLDVLSVVMARARHPAARPGSDRRRRVLAGESVRRHHPGGLERAGQPGTGRQGVRDRVWLSHLGA